MSDTPKITPELEVETLQRSLAFYVDLVGFRIRYDRPEDRFAYLDLDGAHLMLEEVGGSGRSFSDAPLVHPYGRGMNLQIEIDDASTLYARLLAAGCAIPIPLEDRWYRRGSEETGNQQFVVADPDGYLLRFFSDLGVRPVGD